MIEEFFANGVCQVSIFERYKTRYESYQEEVLSLDEHLELCKTDPMAYAGAAERQLVLISHRFE